MVAILVVACKSKPIKIISEEPLLNDTALVISDNDSISSKFLSFIKILDSSGFRYDTIRLQKYFHYRELIRPHFFIENFPIYNIDTNNMILVSSLRGDFIPSEEFLTIDSTTFQNVKSIKAYAFYWENEDGGMEDGVMEEWEFSSNALADIALEEFDKFSGHAYFNTESFGAVNGNYFYLFHSRASQFCFTLDDIFNRFIIFLSTLDKPSA